MKDTLNRFMFKENHWDKNVVFWKSFKTPGRKILRGYVQEQTEKYPFKKDRKNFHYICNSNITNGLTYPFSCWG